MVVDDRAGARRSLRRLLQRSGFRVDEACGPRAVALGLAVAPPDAVVLDAGTRGAGGRSALERIRELGDVPVLVVASRPELLGRVAGPGDADDHLARPFRPAELLDRLEAIIQRPSEGLLPGGRYADGWLELDLRAGRALAGGRPAPVGRAGLRLLAALAARAGDPVPAGLLAAAAWPWAPRGPAARLRIQLACLRAALGPGPGGGSPIATLAGDRYRYTPPNAT